MLLEFPAIALKPVALLLRVAVCPLVALAPPSPEERAFTQTSPRGGSDEYILEHPEFLANRGLKLGWGFRVVPRHF